MNKTHPPSSILHPPSSRLPTWQDRVRTCDNLLGRISFIWEVKAKAPPFDVQRSTFDVRRSRFYFRVSFGIPSPYFDHWAVYRQHEVTVITALDAAPEVKKSIVNSMRPRIPTK